MAFTVSGTVYTDQGVTPMGAGRTVAVSVDGAAVSATAVTDENGNFTLAGVVGTMPVLTVFLKGNAEKGASVAYQTGGTSNVTGFHLYQDCLLLQRPASSAGNVTGAQINTSDNSGDADIAAIYSSSSNGVVSLASGKHLVVRNAGSAAIASTITSISCSGNCVFSGSSNVGTTVTLTGSGTITTNNTAPNVVINASGTYTLAGNISFATGCSLTLQAGTLDVSASNYSISFAGTLPAAWTVTGGTFNARAGTVTFGTVDQLAGVTSNGQYFNNVVIGRTTPLVDAMVVTGNLTINSSRTLNANSQSITVGGNWTNNGGTFTPGAGTVTFNGTNQTIGGSGNTTFYNLVKTVSSADTLTFTSGRTFTVTNSLALQGAADQLLTLQGSAASTWTLVVPATQSLSYLNVSYSTATGNTAAAGATSTDGGNNVNWTFGASASIPSKTTLVHGLGL